MGAISNSLVRLGLIRSPFAGIYSQPALKSFNLDSSTPPSSVCREDSGIVNDNSVLSGCGRELCLAATDHHSTLGLNHIGEPSVLSRSDLGHGSK